jgi:nucleotide-binding universal stress UspA family protein
VYVDPPPLWGDRQQEFDEVDPQLRDALVDRHREFFDEPFEVALMRSDNAALAIADYADGHGVDLVFVGSHGRTGLKRLFIGSVAEATTRHAPCSVWTAR